MTRSVDNYSITQIREVVRSIRYSYHRGRHAGRPGARPRGPLAWLVAEALGRVHAWLACGELGRAADVHGTRSGPPGRIVGELRRVGVRNPVVILDGIDRLDDGGAVAAALREVLAPMPGATFRDRYVDLDFDLSEALFVATANRLGPVPAVLRDDMTVVEVPGYTEAEKRDIAVRHLLPFQLQRHGLSADRVRVTGDAVDAVVRGYTREAGVWGLADALGTVCVQAVRRRAEGDETKVEVTPEVLAAMLGAPAPPEAKVGKALPPEFPASMRRCSCGRSYAGSGGRNPEDRGRSK